MAFDWNDEAVATLKQLWWSGWSARQVAIRLGAPCTRSAVIGKVNRLGIRARSPKNLSYYQAAHTKPVSGGNLTPAPLKTRDLEKNPPKPPSMPAPVEEPPCVVPWLTAATIRDGLCKFGHGEVGTPGFHFCGVETGDILIPWCGHHRARCYTRSARPKDRAQAEADMRATTGIARVFGG